MKFGEILICRFPFTSGALSKPRPTLVLFDLGFDVVLCRISSAYHTGPLDVVVQDWSRAGLIKPSVVRLNRLVTAENCLLVTRLGQLSLQDEQAIRAAWNTHMML